MSDKDKNPNKSIMERMPWSDKHDSEDPYPMPAKLAATWTPDTLIQTGRTPTRGFGGRIFFYDERSRSVPVDGTLIVHGFDETPQAQKEGVKRFEFTPEQLTQHFDQTDFGASYSVWIPWDAVGGNRKRVSLVASFKTSEGKTVQGQPAVVLLPGAEPDKSEADLMSRLSPQFLDYKNALASGSRKASGLTTTTIKRHQYSPNSDAPGIRIPNSPIQHAGNSDTMVATNAATPSAEISMNRRPQTPEIMPASAELPVDENASGTFGFPKIRKR